MNSTSSGPSDFEIVESVYARSGKNAESGGPSATEVAMGVRGFARQFDYWYYRVLEEAIPKYQKLLIDRINPMIRGMQLEGLSAKDVANRLVADYAHRNYVTAGGWALEQLAIDASPRLRKSSATGIDAEWNESSAPPVTNLYVIKSGPVTRNSDILAALKSHGQEAQTRLMQTNRKAVVRVHYVVLTGQTSSSFHDGVHRPSSSEFWAESLNLEDEEFAVDLALAMAQEAGSLLRRTYGNRTTKSLELAVATFLGRDSNPEATDWEFLAKKNMVKSDWIKQSSEVRHQRVLDAFTDSGLIWPTRQTARNVSKVESALTDLLLDTSAVDPRL